jgi:hypothetical protein
VLHPWQAPSKFAFFLSLRLPKVDFRCSAAGGEAASLIDKKTLVNEIYSKAKNE